MKLFIKKTQYGFSHRIKNDYQGKETSMYLDVQFLQGYEPAEDVLQIEVKDGFFSCYESSTGIKPKLVVKDYETIKVFEPKEKAETEQSEDFNFEVSEEVMKDDEQYELPFDYD